MTAPFSKLVNEKHETLILNEKQDQAIRLANSNSRRKEIPAKKKHSAILDIILAMVFIIAMAVAFYVATASHRGAPSIGDTPVSEMSISEQLKMAEEIRYNDN